MKLFAENLKYLRELKGLRQADMLELCGFKQSTWNGYERGVSTPNVDDLIKISDFFGVPESDLLHSSIAGGKGGGYDSGPAGGEGVVEEPGSGYGKPCVECRHLQALIAQKDETIAALQGQVAALQVAVDALRGTSPRLPMAIGTGSPPKGRVRSNE